MCILNVGQFIRDQERFFLLILRRHPRVRTVSLNKIAHEICPMWNEHLARTSAYYSCWAQSCNFERAQCQNTAADRGISNFDHFIIKQGTTKFGINIWSKIIFKCSKEARHLQMTLWPKIPDQVTRLSKPRTILCVRLSGTKTRLTSRRGDSLTCQLFVVVYEPWILYAVRVHITTPGPWRAFNFNVYSRVHKSTIDNSKATFVVEMKQWTFCSDIIVTSVLLFRAVLKIQSLNLSDWIIIRITENAFGKLLLPVELNPVSISTFAGLRLWFQMFRRAQCVPSCGDLCSWCVTCKLTHIN